MDEVSQPEEQTKRSRRKRQDGRDKGKAEQTADENEQEGGRDRRGAMVIRQR